MFGAEISLGCLGFTRVISIDSKDSNSNYNLLQGLAAFEDLLPIRPYCFREIPALPWFSAEW